MACGVLQKECGEPVGQLHCSDHAEGPGEERAGQGGGAEYLDQDADWGGAACSQSVPSHSSSHFQPLGSHVLITSTLPTKTLTAFVQCLT